jgi:integrase
MAKPYRPNVSTYQLPNGKHRTPDGKRVTKNTPGAVRVVRPSKKYYGRYTDGAHREIREPLSESYEISRRMLAKMAGDGQLAGVGLADRYGKHRSRPLAEHLEDYRAYLIGKGDTANHAKRSYRRAQVVSDGCGFKSLDDLDAASVVQFLNDMRQQGTARFELDERKQAYTKAELVAVLGVHPGGVSALLRRAGLGGTGNGKARRYGREVVLALQDRLCRGAGPTTCNHHLTAVKGFTRWLAKERRIPADPLSHLSRQNAEVDIRRQRRALPEDLFARFIDPTGNGKTFRGLSGADRLVLYTLAANTGFRAGELASLSPRSFVLTGDAPTVTVQAAYSKRRRKDIQPLRRDVADMMRQYLRGKPPSKPLWPGNWADDAADMIRFDLAAAGIPYQDEDERFFDFHSLRGQFISMLAAKGVHPKVAQALARHKTFNLTMDKYTHLNVLDVTGALDKLPGVVGAADTEKGRGAGQGAVKAHEPIEGDRRA